MTSEPLSQDPVTRCTCADIAPTMPSFRSKHLSTCPLGDVVEKCLLDENIALRATLAKVTQERDQYEAQGLQRVRECNQAIDHLTERLDTAQARVTWLESRVQKHSCLRVMWREEYEKAGTKLATAQARVTVLEGVMNKAHRLADDCIGSSDAKESFLASYQQALTPWKEEAQ